jgi:lipopolysaccharide transport system permease protein
MLSSVWSDVREMLAEQVEYRELLYRMTARDLLVRYKQSVMGFGWAVFMPLVNTALFSVIFTRVAPLSTDVPYPVFAYTGLLFWNFFASSLRFAVISLSSNAVLVTKIYFPREIFPFSAILVCLVDLAVGSTVLIAMMVYYRMAPSATILYVPVLLLIQVMFTAGIGLLIAMANLFLRDVKYLFEIVLTVWMFATSVVYPIEGIGGRPGFRHARHRLAGVSSGGVPVCGERLSEPAGRRLRQRLEEVQPRPAVHEPARSRAGHAVGPGEPDALRGTGR